MKFLYLLVGISLQINSTLSRRHWKNDKNKNVSEAHEKKNSSAQKNTFFSFKQVPQTQRQLTNNGGSFQNCPCAANFRCPTCGPSGYEAQPEPCPCMPQPSCPNCIMGTILKKYHKKNAKLAKMDAATQSKLANESLVEKKLFEQAQLYAQTAADEEKLAKEAAVRLQEHANLAALSRQKMLRSEAQGKQVAMKAIQTMTQSSSRKMEDTPQISVTAVGTKTIAITQKTPEYQVNVNVGEGGGYYDQQTYDMLKKYDSSRVPDMDPKAQAQAPVDPNTPQPELAQA